MRTQPSSRSWSFAAVCCGYLGVALLFVFAVWLSTRQDNLQLPPPQPEPTFVPLVAAPVLPSWVAVDGLPVVIVATATVTPIPPTATMVAYVWPTATMVTDASGDMDTGGR